MSAHRTDLLVLDTIIPFNLVLGRIQAMQPCPQNGSLSMVLYVHGLLRVQDGRFGVCEQFSTELISKQGLSVVF